MQKDSVPALLATAQAHALLKQVPKARTQLKRLAKAPWTPDEAEDLEKSWLLLADVYCQGGKFDLASELLRRCVQYNKAGRRGRPVQAAGRGARGVGAEEMQGPGRGERRRAESGSRERGMRDGEERWEGFMRSRGLQVSAERCGERGRASIGVS